MEGSFVVIGEKASDSLTLPRLDKDNLAWNNRNVWCMELVKLNESIIKANDMLNIEKRMEVLEEYKNKGAEAAIDNKPRRENTNDDEVEIIEGGSNKVTFIVDQPVYTTAMEEVIQSLENLLRISIDTAAS